MPAAAPTLCTPDPATNVLSVTPVDVFHHEVVNAIVLAGVQRRDDVGMHQTARRANLLIKMLDRFLIAHQIAWQHLQRHASLHPNMVRDVDVPHPAAAQQIADLVFADLRGQHRRPRFGVPPAA